MNGQRPKAGARPRVRKAAKPAAVTAAVLALAAGAAQLATPGTMVSEGMPTNRKGEAVAYLDRHAKAPTPTICFGETRFIVIKGKLERVRMGLKAAKAECAASLSKELTTTAVDVYRVTPGVAKYPHTWAAAIDFTHNLGLGTYQRSSIARLFNAGRWLEGCERFLLYNKSGPPGRKRVLPGLDKRRKMNRADCRRGHIR